MALDKSFFDLQFSFAELARDLSGQSLAAALLDYTNFHVRFGFGRDFDPGREGWQRYLTGLRSAADAREWTYRFYLRDPEANTAPRSVASFGCFSYACPDGNHVRLHFRNDDPGDHSPLGRSRVDRRRAELAALFAHLGSKMDEETPIRGASWLYNLEAYRRLFPPAYVASARPIGGAFRSMALWGQFLDRHGRLRRELAESFSKRTAEASQLSDLDRCFPFQPLRTAAPAREFHDFYLVG